MPTDILKKPTNSKNKKTQASWLITLDKRWNNSKNTMQNLSTMTGKTKKKVKTSEINDK